MRRVIVGNECITTVFKSNDVLSEATDDVVSQELMMLSMKMIENIRFATDMSSLKKDENISSPIRYRMKVY